MISGIAGAACAISARECEVPFAAGSQLPGEGTPGLNGHWRVQLRGVFQAAPCRSRLTEAFLQQQEVFFRLQQLVSSLVFASSGTNAVCEKTNHPRSDAPTPRFNPPTRMALVQIIGNETYRPV